MYLETNRKADWAIAIVGGSRVDRQLRQRLFQLWGQFLNRFAVDQLLTFLFDLAITIKLANEIVRPS